MIFSRKKTSAVDRRLEELRREMSKVGAEIKSLARHKKPAGASGAPRSAGIHSAGAVPPASGGNEAASVLPFPEAGRRRPEQDGAIPGEQENGPSRPFFAPDISAANGGDLPLFEDRKSISGTGREKFANYFMAGHFSNLRPLRQEKRIVKNKAIIMVILVVLALVWLIFFLQ
ncbi:MAG: hypothetical protein PHP98_04445 [Kiritimatiellae bacterium]|nr:hypothetical protein [Kiritimatiellia bacterium]